MSLRIGGNRLEEPVKLSPVLGTCPECGGALYIEVTAWETETGIPIEEHIEVDCENDDVEDDDARHRWWQSEWMPVIDKVRAWGMKHIRKVNT